MVSALWVREKARNCDKQRPRGTCCRVRICRSHRGAISIGGYLRLSRSSPNSAGLAMKQTVGLSLNLSDELSGFDVTREARFPPAAVSRFGTRCAPIPEHGLHRLR